MNFRILKNNETLNALEIKTGTIEEIKEYLRNNELRVIGFFGKQEFENIRLYIALADDKAGEIHIGSVLFYPNEKEYDCFTNEFPSFHMFEREFYEEFGILPKNHPWLKPVRNNQDKYPFFEMKGEEVHEVAVGPIHAGVIEPGHFRFMCAGEKVYDLEIMLGYQHRNIEELIINSKGYNNRLIESVCGDSVIAYNLAYSKISETLSETKITKKAELIRKIALEIERIAVHTGDMGAIAGDMAYLQGNAIFGVTRTLIINTLLEISGSRFGRGLTDVGGVNYDIDEVLSERIIKTLKEAEKTIKRTTEVMLNMPSCISRMEKTGFVSRETTKSLGATGLAAKASGIYFDSRFDFDGYENKEKPFDATGDVYSRFTLRYYEILQSIKLIEKFLCELKEYQNEELKVIPSGMKPNKFGVSIVEGWRGPVVHIAITGANSELLRYKIIDPSFNNWYMLAMAVRNNGISDFPLCNKSFNLSYCGFDL